MTEPNALLARAVEARRGAYAPYSGFTVGAALVDTDGTVWTGANVENASYGLSMCAERTAVFHAVTSGAREFSAIAAYHLALVASLLAAAILLAVTAWSFTRRRRGAGRRSDLALRGVPPSVGGVCAGDSRDL